MKWKMEQKMKHGVLWPFISQVRKFLKSYKNIICPHILCHLQGFLLHLYNIRKSRLTPICHRFFIFSTFWFTFKFIIYTVIKTSCDIQPSVNDLQTIIFIMIWSNPTFPKKVKSKLKNLIKITKKFTTKQSDPYHNSNFLNT